MRKRSEPAALWEQLSLFQLSTLLYHLLTMHGLY
jgi:hypothetical protein